jgi:thioredoxin-dependent peroxiredoxin
MSKKTQKKSSKPSKATRAKSARSVKTAPSKTRGATAAKTSKTKNRQTGNATAKASHKAPSKKLKSPSPGKSAPRPIKASKTAAKPVVEHSAPSKPSAEKPAVRHRTPSKLPAEKPAESAVRSVPASPLAEGAKAPAFSLPRDGGSTVSLDDYAGQKLVLFFYPRADTPGCTKEAIDFTRLASAFADVQTAVLGVSADPLKAQESFRDKHQLSTPLASDEQHEMLEAYGAWGEKSMYGRTFHGVLRTTVLIGDDGRIIRIWRNVKVDGHADEVLAAAQAA